MLSRGLRSKNKKSFLLVVALLTFILSTSIMGTVAWLVDETDPVVNTFTYGDINITLTETDTNLDNDGNNNTNTYSMLPGSELVKDPEVTVLEGSEDCWLFVKLDKSSNFDDFMSYEINEEWVALEGANGVFYRKVDKTTEDVKFTVIKDNKVIVKEEVTKEMLNNLDSGEETNYPVLSITAYAVQRCESVATASDAWSKVVSE